MVEIPQHPIVADGHSRAQFKIRTSDGRALLPSDIAVRVLEPEGRGRVERVLPAGPRGELLVDFVAGVNPGRVTLDLSGREHRPSRASFNSLLATADYFRDGTPDFLSLSNPQDRLAFRHWFTLLAEHQAMPNATRPAEINDCAALLRYAYREAMRRHDSNWATDANMGGLPAFTDISKYTFPYTPLVHVYFARKRDRSKPPTFLMTRLLSSLTRRPLLL